VNYAASKGGVMLMMKSVAQEVAPHKIRVSSICPGAIRTPINVDAWSTPEAYEALMRALQAHRRTDRARSCGGMAGLGRFRLHHWSVDLRGRRYDALSGMRNGGLTAADSLRRALPHRAPKGAR
jgi:NAD(P)-dependent dehydrogenase (short-subunit alcohol dehydrogenase family)